MGPSTIPRIPLSMWDHKLSIAIPWLILLTGSCLLPILLYFILKDVAHLKLAIALGVPSGIFGVTSLLSWFQRFWSLVRKDSRTRPAGSGSRWQLDYFHWNFTLGFCYITALIAYATASKPARVRVVAAPLSILMLQVCSQLVIGWIMSLAGWGYPFRFSSLPKGDPVRPAVYTIVEDVVAVDGKQGTSYRNALNEAYEGRLAIRTIMSRLNLLWGFSGIAVGAMNVGLIFGLKNQDVAWVIGWSVPWAWAGICTVLSIVETRALLRTENGSLVVGEGNGNVDKVV